MLDDINTPELLYKYMKENIKYGFIDRNGIKFLRNSVDENIYMDNIIHNYYFQSPSELLINKCGVCFDQVEFAKYVLKDHRYDVWSFYTKIHNHVFLVYFYNNKYYYFERSFPYHNGIFEFNSFENLFKYYLSIQNDNSLEYVDFYLYDKINYGSDFYDFITSIIRKNDIIMTLKKN